MTDLNQHLPTLRAVDRDKVGNPNAPDAALSAAADDGLIKFKAWPSGHWHITEKGRGVLADQEARP